MIAHLHTIGAVAWRDAMIERTYLLRQLSRLLMLTGAMVFIYYAAKLIGTPEGISEFDGTYFDYLLLGMAVTTFLDLGVGAFTERIADEQGTGTLEIMLATPAPRSAWLLGGFIVPFTLTAIEFTIMIGFGVGVIGAGFGLIELIRGLLVLGVALVSFCAIGIAAASVLVMSKRGDLLSGPITQASLVFSGVFFPIELFPAALRPISWLFPSYWGLRGMRDSMLGAASWADLADEFAVLGAMGLVSVPIALALFRRAIGIAKAAGVLGAY